jgi:hypothetical protein
VATAAVSIWDPEHPGARRSDLVQMPQDDAPMMRTGQETACRSAGRTASRSGRARADLTPMMEKIVQTAKQTVNAMVLK